MQSRDSVFLIGPMGAGKTSVGRSLAACLDKAFVDSDAKISAGHQLSITQIFTQFGEQYFRHREAEYISEVTKIPNLVLATGGGCIENSSTCTLLQKRGVVVYLQVSHVQQLARLEGATDRPLLSQLSSMRHREKVYSDIAHVVVHTDAMTEQQVLAFLVTELEKYDVHYSNGFRA